jgi:hypothetical protein
MLRSSTLFVLGTLVMAFGVAGPAWGPPAPVPEIDPGIAQSALTMLVGGILVLLGQRR